MGTDVIKSFLVGLGFGVDDAGLAKFNKAIASATLKVSALYGATQLMAGAMYKTISSISEGFETMGYEYRIIAPMINKTLLLRREMLKAYSAAGINITKVVQDSVRLNFSITKTRYAFEAIYRSVASRFFPLITKQSDQFRKLIYANMPKIQNALERFVNFIFKAFAATTQLGQRVWSILSRVYDFFVQLDRATNGWSTVILAVVAAWKFLNLEFLATPLGMILAGFAALLALWDDFKTYKEGGLSLIDWGSQTTKTIVGVTGIIGALVAAFYAVRGAISVVTAAQWLWNAAMTANPIGLIIAGITALVAILGVLAYKWGYLKGLTGWIGGLGERMMNFVGGPNVAANLGNTPGALPLPAPIGPNVAGQQTNQTVTQQTNIQVSGAADAAAVGRTVLDGQAKTNASMARNLKGATR